MTEIIIISIILILFISKSTYFDYINSKNESKFSFINIVKKAMGYIIVLALYFGIKFGYKSYIPLSKENNIEYNSERKKLSIPSISENWEIDEYQSNQFITYWWKPKPRNGHFKKVIEYGILNTKFETDYYHNEKMKGTFAWSNYDFNKNSFDYFIEEPNDNNISITEKGQLKIGKTTTTRKINKSEFERYITE